MLRVLVVSSTGVIGTHVLPRLIERGHRVRAVVRSDRETALVERHGDHAIWG